MTCDDAAMIDALTRSHTVQRDQTVCISVEEARDTLAFRAV